MKLEKRHVEIHMPFFLHGEIFRKIINAINPD
jgi:hypothetical protein